MAATSLGIEFQMSLLLFASLLGYLLASRINQSAVIGEILLGLVIGPSFLGLITFTDFVQSIGHLGAVILLFVVGLECKIHEIFNPKYFLIGLVGVIVPWIIGFYTVIFLGYTSAIALFVATTLTATSIAISAKVLQEMGKLDSEPAKAIIGAAVADDVLALIALTITMQLELQGKIDITSSLVLIIEAALFLGVGVIVGNYFLKKQLKKLDRSDFAQRYPEFVFIAAITIGFFYSLVAEYIGLSGILGAFIAGISLEGLEGEDLVHSKDYKEGSEYLHVIFGSVFFVSLGVIADFNALTSRSLILLLAIVATGVVSKIIGCSLPARLFGSSNKDALVIGVGMVPRGEVGMVAALLGLSNRIISQEIYTTLVLMSLLTTMVTPIMLRKIEF